MPNTEHLIPMLFRAPNTERQVLTFELSAFSFELSAISPWTLHLIP